MIYQMNRQFVFNVLFVASLWLSFNFQGPSLVLPPSLTVPRERGRNYILPHPLEFVNTFFEVFSTFFRWSASGVSLSLCGVLGFPRALEYISTSPPTCQHLFATFLGVWKSAQNTLFSQDDHMVVLTDFSRNYRYSTSSSILLHFLNRSASAITLSSFW